MRIEIDQASGFCFGVVNAIQRVEEELALRPLESLYCLGDIVHNTKEVERLTQLGMQTINYQDFHQLHKAKVLFRAHGEAPRIYQEAAQRKLTLIDATCPVVLALQKRIRRRYIETRKERAQIVIYGKLGHAEVVGLVGQTEDEAIVIQYIDELEKLDFNRPIILFSQTTMSLEGFAKLIAEIKQRIARESLLEYHDTICRQVANRLPHVKQFAQSHELIFFLAGEKSSNGKVLFSECLKANPRSLFLDDPLKLKKEMLFPEPKSIGICGATSTPKWQMIALEERIREFIKE